MPGRVITAIKVYNDGRPPEAITKDEGFAGLPEKDQPNTYSFDRRFPHQGSVPCKFGCKDDACGVFYAPAGCICWDDPVQALCAQHALKAEQNGVDLRVICWL